MGVAILIDKKTGYKCMYDTVTMWAFGNIFRKDEMIYEFLEWLPEDARSYDNNKLEKLISEWRKINENKQTKKEN